MYKSINKKLTCLFLSFLVLITCIFIPGFVRAESNNVFSNGDFENFNNIDPSTGENATDTTTWYRRNYGTPYALGNTKLGSQEEIHTGSRSFKISAKPNSNNESYYKYAYYKNFNVEANTEYKITFWYKMTEANGEFRASIATTDKYDTSSNDLCTLGGANNTLISKTVTNGWAKVEATFVSGNNTTLRMILMMYKPSNTEYSTVYVDDIVIEKVATQPPVATSGFTDGGFESVDNVQVQTGMNNTNCENWYRKNAGNPYAHGNTRVGSAEEKHTGERSFKLSATPTSNAYKYSYYKNFNVETNTDYTISFWYKMTEANGEFRASIATTDKYDTNSADICPLGGDGNTLVAKTVTGDWVKVERTFNSGNNTVLRLIFMLYNLANSVPTTIYIDDVNLEKVSTGEEPDVQIESFTDGGFESVDNEQVKTGENTTDIENWYRKNAGNPYAHGNTRVGSAEEKHTGERSFKLSATPTSNAYKYSYYKNFNVETNTDYTISFWYKMTEANGEFRASVATTDKYDTNSADICPLGGNSNTLVAKTVTGEWVKVERTFNSGNNTVLRLIFMLYNLSNSVPTTIYIDDVNLEKVSTGEEPDVQIESFTDGGFESVDNEQVKTGENTTDIENWYRKNAGTPYAHGDTRVGSSEEKHTGERSFKLSATPTSNNYKYSYYKNFSVEANTEYTISFWYKMTDANGEFRSSVATTDKYDTNSSDLCPMGGANNSLVSNSITNEWVKAEQTFNSGNNTVLRLIFMLYNLSNSVPTTIYIDDIAVVKGDSSENIPENPPVDKGFVDGSFEKINNAQVETGENSTDIENWYRKNAGNPYAHGATKLGVSEEAHLGVNSMKISANPASGGYKYSYYKNFSVDSNTYYAITFWYKMTAANGEFRASVTTTDKYETNSNDLCPIGGEKNTLVCKQTTDGWVEITKIFNSGDNDILRLIFMLHNPSTAAETTVFVDDIIIEKYDKSKIISNGGFEDGVTRWGVSSNNICIDTTEFYEGKNSLHLSNECYSLICQELLLETNTNYEISFYYKGIINETASTVGISAERNFESNNLLISGKLQSKEEWTKCTYGFNSLDRTSLYLLFQCTPYSDFYLDNVSISKTNIDYSNITFGTKPILSEIHTKTRYLCDVNNNIISSYDFENIDEWNRLLNSTCLSIVNEENAISGNNVLKYSSNTQGNVSEDYIFYGVEPNTDYTFSVWVKGAYWSDVNHCDLTFGVADASTGKLLEYEDNTSTEFNSEFQMCPPAWDEEWHLIGINFNTKSLTGISIAFFGNKSTAYFDNFTLCKKEKAVEYVPMELSRKNPTITNLNPKNEGCNNIDNLFKNFDLSDSSSDYWQEGMIYGNKVTIKDSNGTKGNSLYYKQNTEIPERIYYIKWIDVKPNTEYTFSSIYQIITPGEAFFGLITGSRYLPTDIIRFNTDIGDFDENYKWQNASVSFNTNGYDRIGFIVCDCGGEFFIDNLRLFETSKGTVLKEKYDFPKTITSSVYSIKNGFVGKIPQKTLINDFINGLDQKLYIKVFANDKLVSDSSFVGTSMSVKLMDGYEIVDSLNSVVTGDVTGDGIIDLADSSSILKFITRKEKFSESQILAADINMDELITVHDSALINQDFTQKKAIVPNNIFVR